MNQLFLVTLLLAGHHLQKHPKLPTLDAYYGCYVKGSKVGWVHTTAHPQSNDTFVITVEVHNKIVGMGHVSEAARTFDRVYSLKSEELLSLSLVATNETGVIKVVGHRTGAAFELTTNTGDGNRVTTVTVDERLHDMEVDARLAAKGVVGATAQAVNFDPILKKNIHVAYTVKGIEAHGASPRSVHMSILAVETHTTSEEWLDKEGLTSEWQEGVESWRLEPRDTAQRVEVKGDIINDMVVHAPQAIKFVPGVVELKVEFVGMDKDFVPPTSPRQQVVRTSDSVTLTLRRDPMPMRIPISALQIPSDGADEIRKDLRPSTFIESDAKEIIATAKEIVGDENDAFVASNRLLAFVNTTLKSEYVAGYGDALLVLHSKKGDCTEHAVLFVALARAAGIPARVVEGITYVPKANGFGWHAWAELYMNGRWTAVDPTFGQPIADATHIKMSSRDLGMNGDLAQVVGKVSIRQMSFQ